MMNIIYTTIRNLDLPVFELICFAAESVDRRMSSCLSLTFNVSRPIFSTILCAYDRCGFSCR